MMFQAFLVGAISLAAFIACLFFLRFWRDTRDFLFFSFAVFFFVEGVNRVALLFVEHPNEGSPWIYGARLCSLLVILGAILNKNYGPKNSG